MSRIVGPVWIGASRRATPVSYHWGRERGTPIDRYYIEQFLDAHRADIRGRVLEVMDSRYTDRFGASVERVDVLDVSGENSAATIVADLGAADPVPSEAFDCFVLTQTLHYVYDLQTAVRQIYRLLREDGVVLATLPAVSKIDTSARVPDLWRFTAASAERLFADVFGREQLAIESYGNVLAANAFLMGIAAEEVPPRKLDHRDPVFPVVLAVRAVRS